MKTKTYFIYITTNPRRTALYIGVTNHLARRLFEHKSNRGNNKTFAGKYYCYNLVHYEVYYSPLKAIAREKELKGWRREKKNALINTHNPEWRFLNGEV